MPGCVPPLPLRAGVRVLCDARLAEAGTVYGSSGDERLRLYIRDPRSALPTLAAAAAAAAATDPEQHEGPEAADACQIIATAARVLKPRPSDSPGYARRAAAAAVHDALPTAAPTLDVEAADADAAAVLTRVPFAWLPPMASWYPTLDDALDVMSAAAAASMLEPGAPVPCEGGRDAAGPSTQMPQYQRASGSDGFSWDIAERAAAAAAAATGGDGAAVRPASATWLPPAAVRIIVDPTLSVLARKLRMVGIDCVVAGEVLREPRATPRAQQQQLSPPPSPPPPSLVEGQVVKSGSSTANSSSDGPLANGEIAGEIAGPLANGGAAGGGEIAGGSVTLRSHRSLFGLLRVTINPSSIDVHLRVAALQGRLLVTSVKRTKQPAPCATYRLLETRDAGKQLAEVLDVLQLSAAAESDASRCGICNGDAWRSLRPHEVSPSEVPRAILTRQTVFYQCGVCSQIFWPAVGKGRTVKSTGLADGGGAAESAVPVSAVFRPSSQIVMALGAKAKGGLSGGAMLREARRLHADLRMKQEVPRAVHGATYYY